MFFIELVMNVLGFFIESLLIACIPFAKQRPRYGIEGTVEPPDPSRALRVPSRLLINGFKFDLRLYVVVSWMHLF